ncbi:Gfo/Idh/MocA family oxidoreductase [Listeria booriae]|uniref:Gfo/Idh/MocA family oxidoreductase n=1 Tax=Listeria booriae TaxID=1552123 RepID=A0A842AZ28_9LIST|nr:Gfo/Idh/MocA family oxidoreductase [Listeria booriae]MBC1796864.1 Gfo/Idh/MocA family oxidoreductase [Listeria booriae]
MKYLNLAIIGTGSISEEVLQALENHPEIKVKAIWGRNLANVLRLQETHDIEYFYLDYEELLKNKDIHCCYIATPNATHESFAQKAVESKKHVIVEKTAFPDIEIAKRTLLLAEEKGVFIFEAMRTIYEPNFTVLKKGLAQIGEIYSVNLVYQNYSKQYAQYKSNPNQLPPIFSDKRGQGVWKTIGIYPIYIALDIFGEPEDVSLHRYFANSKIDFGGILILTYPNFLISIFASKSHHDISPINKIYGEYGTLSFKGCYNITDIRLELIGEKSRDLIPHDDRKSIIYEFNFFAQSILNNNVSNYRKTKKTMLDAIQIIERLK